MVDKFPNGRNRCCLLVVERRRLRTAESSVLNCSSSPRSSARWVYSSTGTVLPQEQNRATVCQKGEQETSEESAREGRGSLVEPHLADFGVLIYMNRKYRLLHPMLVDVDLKEGYPDGWA